MKPRSLKHIFKICTVPYEYCGDEVRHAAYRYEYLVRHYIIIEPNQYSRLLQCSAPVQVFYLEPESTSV